MMKNISIVLSGEAGQGIKTLELLVIKALVKSGYYVFSTTELMSRVRGGNNTTEIRISSKKVSGFVDRIDILFVLGRDAITRLESRLSKDTIIIGQNKYIDQKYKDAKHHIKEIDLALLSKDIGGVQYTNSIVYGIIAQIFNIDKSIALEYISRYFGSKGSAVVDNNGKALIAGINSAKHLDIRLNIPQKTDKLGEILLSGTESIGIGALSGGCNFIAAYPMSPSTSVIKFMADNSEEFGVVVEQAEDEIAAINMIQGAWYAGARAMTTTSGGGFVLMEEGISNAAMTEVPIVIHLAQRPGPSTGLATKTEQADLNLALYAGHGEFPRILLAPGNFADGILLSQKAFYLADKYQLPVIILTDQYYIDSYQTIEPPDFSKFNTEHQFIKTGKEYARYKFTEDGISPRGIPTHGEGFVRVDSHEHNEDGFLTENPDIRTKMVDKRFSKLETYKKEGFEAIIIGPKEYNTLIVGWGSTYGMIKEAIEELNDDKTAFAHFNQVYPLPENTKEVLSKADRLIMVENNATAQFAHLIRKETGIEFDNHILKYDGTPFSTEEILEQIKVLA